MLPAADTWTLAAIAFIAGIALLWIWKRFANQDRFGLARRQMRAQLYAMRLYADEPVLVFRAQAQLLTWIGRYLACTLRPMAVAIVPFLLIFPQLEEAYGHRPLVPGEPVTVTARFPAAAAAQFESAKLMGHGVRVETPGVHIADAREVCWRVRSLARVPGSVVLDAGVNSVTRSIPCGRAPFLPPLPFSSLPSLDFACPTADLDLFGFGVAWPVWFLLMVLVTMLALRKRFGIAPLL